MTKGWCLSRRKWRGVGVAIIISNPAGYCTWKRQNGYTLTFPRVCTTGAEALLLRCKVCAMLDGYLKVLRGGGGDLLLAMTTKMYLRVRDVRRATRYTGTHSWECLPALGIFHFKCIPLKIQRAQVNHKCFSIFFFFTFFTARGSWFCVSYFTARGRCFMFFFF